MRSIAFLIVIAELVLLGPLYLWYGQVDPCRALAKQMAMKAEAAGGVGVVIDKALGDLEIDARKDIADRSTTTCAADLVAGWAS